MKHNLKLPGVLRRSVLFLIFLSGVLGTRPSNAADDTTNVEIVATPDASYAVQDTFRIRLSAKLGNEPKLTDECGVGLPRNWSTPTWTWTGPSANSIVAIAGGSVNSPTVDIQLSFNDVGHKTVNVSAQVSYTSNCGNRTGIGHKQLSFDVVGVNYLQYRKVTDSAANYQTANTIRVPVGSKLIFRAIPNLPTSSWPTGKPIWNGGPPNQALTKQYDFDEVSTNPTDFKLVTATCGNSSTIKVFVYKPIYEYSNRPFDTETQTHLDVFHEATRLAPGNESTGGETPPDSKASAGETVTFNAVEREDEDSRREIGGSTPGPWETFDGLGFVQVNFTVTGEADFNEPNSGDQSLQKTRVPTQEVPLFIRSNWTGSPIVVTMTLVDRAEKAIEGLGDEPGDIGTTKDPDRVYTWKIVPRSGNMKHIGYVDEIPVGQDYYTPHDASYHGIYGPWGTKDSLFTYRVWGDNDPPVENLYLGEVVTEQFTAPTAAFTLADIDEDWLDERREEHNLVTADDVAGYLWGGAGGDAPWSANTGSFIVQEGNKIYDGNGGSVTDLPNKPFTTTALRRSPGVGYKQNQIFKAGNYVLGTFAMDLRAFETVGGEFPGISSYLKKTGPAYAGNP